MSQDPFDTDFSAPVALQPPTYVAGPAAISDMPPPPGSIPQTADPALYGSPPPGYLHIQPAKKSGVSPLKILGIGVALLVLLIVALLIFSVWLVTDQQSTAQREVPQTARIGDCVTASSSVVDCGQAHRYEVFGEGDWFGSVDYPDILTRSGGSGYCEDVFEPYVGSGYWTSDFDFTEVYPTEAAWESGDRRVMCVIHSFDMSDSYGSAAGSGR